VHHPATRHPFLDASRLSHQAGHRRRIRARRLGSEPVGLLASVRILAGGQATSAAGAGLPAGRLTRIQVGPLTVPAFEAALRASVGVWLSRLTVRRLFDASGGNPFYGLELARALNRAGGEPSPGEPLPVPADRRGY
jgi:hypothetical protein